MKTYLACDCRCIGACKHAYALLLKLREVFAKNKHLADGEGFVLCHKNEFSDCMTYAKGNISVQL